MPSTNIINVNSLAELDAALFFAKGGETIVLADGDYGTLDISNQNYSSMVTIKAANDLGAKIENIVVSGSSNIRVDGVHVDYPTNGGAGTKLVSIKENSRNIEIVNSEINAKVDGTYEGYGVYIKDSDDIVIENNNVHNIGNGISAFGSVNLQIIENYVDYVGSDFLKGGGITNYVIANNTGGGNLFPSPTAHADFLQLQGSSTNGVISGNVFLAQTTERAQGIFLGAGFHKNVVIEQNIIYSGKNNAVYVKEGSGIKVLNNTLLATPNEGQKAALIITPPGTIKEDNITSSYVGGFSGSNVVAQWDDTDDINHYSDLFANAMLSLNGITLADLVPVAGSVADGKGAYIRLMDLLNGTTVTPNPTTDPTTDPTDPDDGSAGTTIAFDPTVDVVYENTDVVDVSSALDVVEIGHTSAMALDEFTVLLTFNADNLIGKQGLVSKDAAGNGDHFAVWLDNGNLNIRVQNDTASQTMVIGNVQAGRDYDLQVAVGNGTVQAWLDGNEVGSLAFDTSWATSNEYLQFGANGWASNTGESGFQDVFDGTLTNMYVVGDFITPSELIQNGGGTTGGNPSKPGDLIIGFETPLVIDDASDVIELAHNSSLELEAGIISFSFNADTIGGRQGLVSKDATTNGNHFATWLEDDELTIRFQDNDRANAIRIDGITAGQTYEVDILFGDGRYFAWLDGEKIAGRVLDADWTLNNEFLQIGANGFRTDSGDAGFRHVFDGTIDDFAIYNGTGYTHDQFDFFPSFDTQIENTGNDLLL